LLQIHEEMAMEVTNGNLAAINGVVMDNPKANRKACLILEERHITWVCIGCQAHSLNLGIKVRIRFNLRRESIRGYRMNSWCPARFSMISLNAELNLNANAHLKISEVMLLVF
jgi:hypothetical protein